MAQTEATRSRSGEQHRIKVLREYAILDSKPEREFDDLAALAANICGTPIALISLVDDDRQWFKARVGLDSCETPRSQSFCAHALDSPEIFIVPDARIDPRFTENPLVTGKPGIRFYAGAPLVSSQEAALGTLCVIDRVPRELNSAQQWAMQSLAGQVMNRLELRRLRGKRNLPGVQDLQLHELRVLVSTDPHRTAMWTRLLSFLAWPILKGEFAHAFVRGELISDQPYPREIQLVLEPLEAYGPAAFDVIGGYLNIGLEKIKKLHSIELNFHLRNAPTNIPQIDPDSPLANPYSGDSPEGGTIRINLRDPNIIQQFNESFEPFRAAKKM